MNNTNWKKVKLGEICTIKTGKLNANAAVENGEYAFFTCSRETFRTDRYSFDGEALLIAGNGDVGFTKYYSGKFDAYQRTYVLMNFSVNIKYIYYYLQRYLPARIEAEMMGSAVPYIKLGTLSDMEIQVPSSLEEQRRIASLLSRFDELIQLHEFKADNLIKAKQQIMSDIFSGGLRGLDEINPDDYVQDNWVTVKLGDIFDIRNGYTPSKSVSEYWENGTIPWFRVEDIRENGRVLSDAIQHVNILGVKGGKLMPANSLILSTSATVGEHALVKVDCLTNQRFISCTLKSKFQSSIDLMYLFYCFYKLGEWCRDNADAGSTFSSIPTTRVKEYQLKIPPTLEEQQKIANLLSSYDSLIELKQSQKQQVTNMKQQLMTQLLTNGGAEQLDNC